ncbi:hypothetical protein SLA2020_017330 [Shorea laevis]
MKFGSHQNDLDSPSRQSSKGSFRKFTSGFQQNDLDSFPGQSLDGSFRKSNSVISAHSVSGISVSSKYFPTSRRVYKGLKDFGKRLLDQELFTEGLKDWVLENYCADPTTGEESFMSPFQIDELRKLDLALEGVSFQQLCRMPCSPYVCQGLEEDEYFAFEDFLHAVVSGLWRTFWRKSGPLPFFLSCSRHPGSKFYSLEKVISRGRLNEIHGLALMSKTENDLKVHWGQVLELALFKSDMLSGNELILSSSSICEALFYGVHILISRSLGKSSSIASDSVFLLVFDSKFGAVVKIGGDLSRLEFNSANPYQSVAEWIKCHAEVSISSVDRIWNKLGNASWGDLGTLQVILATFYSIVQYCGPPRKSIASLASEHSLRLQKRRIEWNLADNENALVPFEHVSHQNGEIVELDKSDNPYFRKNASCLKLKQGEVLLLEDQREGLKRFQIQESLIGANCLLYAAICLEHPIRVLTLFVGAHPSRLEPSWEDMSLWYQVQRQTKVLNTLKQQGILSKYLPELIASGRILHSGPCKKQIPSGRCDHPWCGTPILVTSPVGEPLSYIISRDGPFSPMEALHCCRNCLTALSSAATANVQHGDICPENIIRVVESQGTRNKFHYILTSWGRAVLEDRDSPAINLQFSSSHALQHGKLCPSSDAESLVYLLYFISGGTMHEQDSIESALLWRERSWANRSIQQHLGEVSPLLKAFADYVDSLCGTPYPVDYDIWLKRLNSAVDGDADRGKMIEEMAITWRPEDVAESSGTSVGGT